MALKDSPTVYEFEAVLLDNETMDSVASLTIFGLNSDEEKARGVAGELLRELGIRMTGRHVYVRIVREIPRARFDEMRKPWELN